MNYIKYERKPKFLFNKPVIVRYVITHTKELASRTTCVNVL